MASGYIVVGLLSGAVHPGDALAVGSNTFATATSEANSNAASVQADHDEFSQLATEAARAKIQQVPGSGPVRGVVVYNGVAYAWRDDANATEAIMYRATPTGWQAVASNPVLAFTDGSGDILPGQTVSNGGGIGAPTASATVVRVVVQSGSTQVGDATGYLVLSNTAGTFAANDPISNGVGGATAIASVPATAMSFPPGGRYEFRIHNFYGHTNMLRLYGVNCVGNAFEYQDGPDGFLAPIVTGMAVDKPTHIAVQYDMLWLSFIGGSVQHSGAGEPASWQVMMGAGEIAVGDEVTGFLEEVSSALFVFCRNRIDTIQMVEIDFQKRTYSADTGALPNSIGRIFGGLFIDDRGYTTLAATDRFGNFSSAAVSARINPIMNDVRRRITCTGISRTRNLYRTFMDDGHVVSIGYRNGKIVGFTSLELGIVMHCAWSGEESNGDEFSLLGGADGFVYRMDRGTSLDGRDIISFLRTPYHFTRTPSRNKRYRLADFDVRIEGPCTLKIAPDYSYGRSDVGNDPVRNFRTHGGGGFWDVSYWNEFVWSAGPQANAPIKLEGAGTSVGFLISHQSKTEPPHTVQGVKLHYSFRRLNREAISS
jgi:hypothetical protein